MKLSSAISTLAYVALAHAKARDELTAYTGPCTAETRAICAQTSKLFKADPSLGNLTASNPERCYKGDDYWIQDTDTVLAPLDAVYNGTAKMSTRLLGEGQGCPEATQESSYAYQLRVGSTGIITGTNRTRSLYDDNPFYMLLTWFYPALDNKTADAETAGDVYMVSSQSWYEYGQHWTLNHTKSGDGFDIAGELTTHKYADNQGLWYRIGKCDNFYTSWEYKTGFLIKDCTVVYMTLTGHISPDKAEVKITTQVFNQPGGPTLDYTFTGNAIPGPKLLTSEANPVTDGKLNVTGPGGNGKTNTASSSTAGRGGWVAAGLAAFALVMMF